MASVKKPASTRAFSQKIESLHRHQKKKENMSDLLKQYKVKVGFEIHCQMLTRHKLFSSSLGSQLEQANTHCNLVDLALPGMLPVLNEECLNLAVKASLALKGHINSRIKFDRKHYYYSDLPQGYQITQKEHPIMERGQLYFFDRFNQERSLSIQRIQIE